MNCLTSDGHVVRGVPGPGGCVHKVAEKRLVVVYHLLCYFIIRSQLS